MLQDDPNILTYYNKLFKRLEGRKNGPFKMGSLMNLRNNELTLYASFAILYERTHTSAEIVEFHEKFAKERGLETRVELYRKLKRYDAAIEDLTKILETTKSKPYRLMERGDLYVLTNRFDKAVDDYEAAKEIDNELLDIDEKILSAKQKMR